MTIGIMLEINYRVPPFSDSPFLLLSGSSAWNASIVSELPYTSQFTSVNYERTNQREKDVSLLSISSIQFWYVVYYKN